MAFFDSITPTLLRPQVPLAFAVADREHPRVRICIFQCAPILFSLLSTAHSQNSAGRSVTVYVSEDLMIKLREQSIRVCIPPCTVVYQKFGIIHTYQSPGLSMKRSSIGDRGLRSVYTVSVAHPASYAMGTGGSFPVVKAIGTLSLSLNSTHWSG